MAAAQGLEERRAELLERLLTVDPIAADLLAMNSRFIEQLLPIADEYEAAGRLHSAIRVHKEILALDPSTPQQRGDRAHRLEPRPELGGDAKPADLLEGVSREWIREHDEKSRDWGQRVKLERENYVTETNAGYEVLVRAAEAMEQMNAFYRSSSRSGPRNTPDRARISLLIFRERDEYLKLGSGPVEWSGGQFTGDRSRPSSATPASRT